MAPKRPCKPASLQPPTPVSAALCFICSCDVRMCHCRDFTPLNGATNRQDAQLLALSASFVSGLAPFSVAQRQALLCYQHCLALQEITSLGRVQSKDSESSHCRGLLGAACSLSNPSKQAEAVYVVLCTSQINETDPRLPAWFASFKQTFYKTYPNAAAEVRQYGPTASLWCLLRQDMCFTGS